MGSELTAVCAHAWGWAACFVGELMRAHGLQRFGWVCVWGGLHAPGWLALCVCGIRSSADRACACGVHVWADT